MEQVLSLQQEVSVWKNISVQLLNKLNEVIQQINDIKGTSAISKLKLEDLQSNQIATKHDATINNDNNNTSTKQTEPLTKEVSTPKTNEHVTPSKRRKVVIEDDEIPKTSLVNVPEDQILLLDTPVQATRKRLKKISGEEPASQNITNNNSNNNTKPTILPASKPQAQQRKKTQPKKSASDPTPQDHAEQPSEGRYNTRRKRSTVPPKGRQRTRAQHTDYPSDSEDSSYHTESGKSGSSGSSSSSSSSEDEEEEEESEASVVEELAPKKTRTSASQSTPKKPTKKFSATASKYYHSSDEDASDSDNNFIVDDEEVEESEPATIPVKRKGRKLGRIDDDEIDDLLATQGAQQDPDIMDESDSEKDENFIVADDEVEYADENNNAKQKEPSPVKKMSAEDIKKGVEEELESKQTPIHNAIAKNDLEQMEYLIKKHGWEILRTKDAGGTTTLMCAVEAGNMKSLNCILYCLINNDTNFEKIIENTAPEVEELFATFVDAQKMEDIREEIIHSCDRYGLNAFFYCCRFGRYQMFRHLFGVVTMPAAFESPSEVKSSIIKELGAIQDHNGAYLLHHAAACKDSQSENLITHIIENRINDINCKDNEQSTPLHWAAGGDCVDALRVLIMYGANVELTDMGGSTALHMAAANGHVGCVNILIHEGHAEVKSRDRAGWPPLLYSNFQAHRDIVLLLLEADPSTLSVLGDRSLLQDPRGRKAVIDVFNYVAGVPQFYGILNNFLRNNIHLLGGSFSFLLEKKGLLDLENKRLWMLSNLEHKLKRTFSASLEVDRNNLVDDTLHQVMKKSFDPRAATFKATFRNEQGYGAGVRREFFQVVSSAILKSEKPKLFKNVNNQGYQPIYTQDTSKNSDYYKLTGMIIGMAILHKELTSFHFTKPFLKQLLSKEVGFEDIQDVDQGYFSSLKWMLENDISDMEQTFCVDMEDEETGTKHSINLIPNGKNIPVTEKNKAKYVELLAKWKLVTSFEVKKECVLAGLEKVFQTDLLTYFNENELQLLISGLHKIDVDDWERYTIYNGYAISDPQIEWFWKVVKQMSEEERALLLQFATGSSNVPLGGFQELQGMSGKQKFTIMCVPNDPPGRLISASTCFNLLKVPRYGSFNEMHEKIHVAIRFGVEGFAFS